MRGRGSVDNPANRFARLEIEPDPDYADGGISPQTRFYHDDAARVIARNDSPDIPFEASLNPYRGCEHGCIYCYARPFHEYLDMSPGLDFETRIMVKTDAPQRLRKELQSRSWEPRTLSISGVTDPYQPVERKLGITRACLQVLRDFRNPFSIITKNYLVTRDIDILGDMAKYNAVRVMISITSLDSDLIRSMEPRTSRPDRRLKTIAELSKAGIPVGVMFAPVIPGLTDEELPRMVEAASGAGASFANYVLLRLPGPVLPMFQDWLERHLPYRKKKIMSRLKSLRGGDVNDSRYGHRMQGEGAFADQLQQTFRMACRKHRLRDAGAPLSIDYFRKVPSQGELGLF